jgi:hypothetical protein
LLLIASGAAAAERWYVFSIGETPVGYVIERTDGPATETVVFARLTRLGKSIEMRFAGTARESADGELQSLSYEALLSKQATKLEARVEGDGIVIASGDQQRTIARGEAPVLGAAAIARLTTSRLRNSGDAIDYAIFSPELQRVTRVRRRVLAVDEPVRCANTSALKMEETMEGPPAARSGSTRALR